MEPSPRAPDQPFLLEALVDFPDDALENGRALTRQDIDAMMAKLADMGMRRVVWGYYGDGHGGWLNPAGYTEDYQGGWKHYDETYRTLDNPLKVATEAGHRHGLDVYAYFKPYETGAAVMFPEGSPQAGEWGRLDCLGGKLAWMDPFVAKHPELRVQRRTDDIPAGTATAAIRAIRLTKKDASPTRITRNRLQIWTSEANFRYRRASVAFDVSETVGPAPRDVRDHAGNLLTTRGDPVRMLLLSGLNLTDPFVLVTTDFAEGTPDFTNAGLSLMTALDARGHEIPCAFASGGAIWCANLVDFRNGGLMFDYGFGAAPVALDAPNAGGKQGFIALARGRNAYLPGALCETEPAVQDFWLSCLDEMIAAEVDGVDIREENHSTHTDYPEDYGFNPVVLARCRAGGDLRAVAARVRGDAYTEFLRRAKARLAASGRRLRYHLNMDWFRPDPPPCRALAYPANLRFDWERWLDEGLMDAAVLRSYHHRTAMLTDAFGAELVSACRRRGIPIAFNHHIFQDEAWYRDEALRVAADGRFTGLILYETYSFLRTDAPGVWNVRLNVAEQIGQALR
jgi:hypothetical protein